MGKDIEHIPENFEETTEQIKENRRDGIKLPTY